MSDPETKARRNLAAALVFAALATLSLALAGWLLEQFTGVLEAHAADRTYRCTAPRTVAWGAQCDSDTLAHSSITVELWCQPRRSAWVPLNPAVWAAEWRPFLVASRAGVRPGAPVVFVVPDTLPLGGTVMTRTQSAGGRSPCWGNVADAKR